MKYKQLKWSNNVTGVFKYMIKQIMIMPHYWDYVFVLEGVLAGDVASCCDSAEPSSC